jgi:hypothetical protein
MGLSSDIIESGYVRKRGSKVKVIWKVTVVGEDVEPKLFEGVNKCNVPIPQQGHITAKIIQ